MAITQDRTAIPAAKEPFWRKEVKMLPGGFSFKQEFPQGSIIRKASPLYVDFDTMSAAVVKIGKVLQGGTTSAPRLAKGHNFVAGDTVMTVGNTANAVTVKSVDRSNTAYDVVTFSAALTGATKDAFVQEAKNTAAEGQTAVYAAAYTPNMVLGADVEIKEQGLFTLDAAFDAVILKSIAAPIPDSWLIEGGAALKTNPRIMYINQ